MQTDRDRFEVFLDFGFQFDRQADPVPASLRPKRRVPLLLLMLAKSRAATSTLKGLHLLNWALRTPSNMTLLINLLSQLDDPDVPAIRIEPALDRAIDIAIGLGWVEQSGGRTLSLADDGREIVREIEGTDTFRFERAQLARLQGKLTQKDVERLLDWRLL